MKDNLSVQDGLAILSRRIIIPWAMRKEVLECLHSSHQGIDKTKRRARESVYWPSINSDIKNAVSSCEACTKYLPSQPQETMKTDPPPAYVFQQVSADLFYHAGITFLVYVDRLSGWPIVHSFCRSDPNATQIANVCREHFSDLGVPEKFRCDNGPQFTWIIFKSFLDAWGVQPMTDVNPILPPIQWLSRERSQVDETTHPKDRSGR